MLEVIETVKRVSGVDFKVEIAPRREGDPAQIVADSQRARATLTGSRASMISRPSSRMRSPGSAQLMKRAQQYFAGCRSTRGGKFRAV